MTHTFKVIDLFCGCGGLSQGFIDAQYDVVLGIDSWNDAIQTFEFNHPSSKGYVGNLFKETPEDIALRFNLPQIDVVIGGPPCQGFSLAGKRDVFDERNQLYKSFVRFVDYFKPKAFVMENVPNIISMDSGRVRDSILLDFERIGYRVVYKVLLSSHFGVPQNRKRAFFVGIKTGEKFIFPQMLSEIAVTVGEAIADLPEHSIVDGDAYSCVANSPYQVLMRGNSTGVYNHQISQHKVQTVQVIAQVPDGGNYKNLPSELQSIRNVNIAWTRLNSNKPSFTIDTGHRHHFHYRYNRVPTVRESARLQSFADDFIFKGSKTSQYKQVGNAVPPMLARVLAQALRSYL